MLSQPPDVGLVACQTCAVDAALLAGSDADGLTILHVADTVRLRVFQCDEADDEIASCLRTEGLVLRGDVLEEGIIVEANLVASLLECDAKHLLALDGVGGVRRINLDDIIRSFTLGFQNLDGLGCIVGGDDAVADFAFDDKCSSGVAGVAQCDEVTIARHAVGSTSTSIGTSDGALIKSWDVVDKVDFLQCVAQRQTYGGTSRRYVLERCCRRETCGLAQLFHELPGVQRVEEIDVARTSVNHFDGQFALTVHEDA